MTMFGKLVVVLVLAFLAYPAGAQETHSVYRPDGTHIFDVRFFGVGDGPFVPTQPLPMESTWNLSPLQKAKILEAVRYWGELITPVPGQLPAVVNVGAAGNPDNAAGGSDTLRVGDFNMQLIQAGLLGHPVPVEKLYTLCRV